MIEEHTQKLFFVDSDFLEDLKASSIIEYKEFNKPQVDTQVIQLPVSTEQLREIIPHVPPSEIRVGNVLAKSNYTDQFGPIDEFAEDHATRKYRLWVQLCIALGAKKVKVQNIESNIIESQDKSSWGADIKAQAPIASLEAGLTKASTEIQENLNKKMLGIETEALGGMPDTAAAEDLLRRYDLFKDDMFRSMYEIRKIKSNQLVKHEFTLDFTTDMKRMFDSTTKAKLSAISKIYKGRADISGAIKSIEKSKTAIKLSITVEF